MDTASSQLTALRQAHESESRGTCGDFSNIIRQLQLKTGVEIGVAFGECSEAILTQTNVERLFGVDSYTYKVGRDDLMNVPQSLLDELFQITSLRLKPFAGRFVMVRDDPGAAADKIDVRLDFTYIHADCTYDGLWRNLCCWFGKLRNGGVIGGCHYGHSQFPGIKQAVNEFFGRFDWAVNVEKGGDWWVQKRPAHVSFIVPAYNCEKTVIQSLESIISGNLSEGDEIVVVDDHSTDGTNACLRRLAKQYPALTLVEHSSNRGGGAARNTAVDRSSNSLIFCLDSDNVLVAGSVDRLKRFLEETGSDIASFEHARFFRDSVESISHLWSVAPGVVSLSDSLRTHKTPGCSGNYLFTKESWRRASGYPESAGALDTWGFGLRQLANSCKMRVLADSFYYHRFGNESYWMRQEALGDVSLRALQVMIPYLDLIMEDDVTYMLSERGRVSWFSKLEQRPIRLRTSPGQQGKIQRLYSAVQRSVLGRTERLKDRLLGLVQRSAEVGR